jgi:hypothetical protein
MTQQPSKSQWPWVILVSLGVCLVSSLPYIAGWFAQTPDHRYAWVAVQSQDTLSYFAKMLQGRQGQWVFHLTYTAQPDTGIPVYLYYLFLGHLSGWLNLTIPLVFHLARVLQGLVLLLVAYAFIRVLTTDARERGFIFLLVCLSSGVMSIPESDTFYTLMDNPHFILSQTLLLLIVAAYLLPAPSKKGARWTEIGLMALATGALAELQPHMLVTAVGVGGVYTGLRWVQDRKVPIHLLVRLVASLLSGAAVAGVTYLLLNADPITQAWQQQNQTPSPPVLVYMIGFALLLVPAVSGAIWAIRTKSPVGSLLIIWCLVTFISIYAPTSLQRRLISGVHLPLAFLAGLGICRVWVTRWKIAWRWAWGYQVCTWIVSALLVVSFTMDVVHQEPGLYLTAAEDQALNWMREQAPPGSVILSSPAFGQFIPAFTPQRVVIGHWAETVNEAEIRPRVAHFYSDASTPADRCFDLKQWGVNYVILGPRERDLGATWDWSAKNSGLVTAASFGDVEIDQVNCD